MIHALIFLIGNLFGMLFAAINTTNYEETTTDAYNVGYEVGKSAEKKENIEVLKRLHAESENCPKFEKVFRQVAFEEAIDIVKRGSKHE